MTVWTDSRSLTVSAGRYVSGRCSIVKLSVPGNVKVGQWVPFEFVGHVDQGYVVPVMGLRNDGPGDVQVKLGTGGYYTIPPGGLMIRRAPSPAGPCTSFTLPKPYYIRFLRPGKYRLTFMVGYWESGAIWTQTQTKGVGAYKLSMLLPAAAFAGGLIVGLLIAKR